MWRAQDFSITQQLKLGVRNIISSRVRNHFNYPGFSSGADFIFRMHEQYITEPLLGHA